MLLMRIAFIILFAKSIFHFRKIRYVKKRKVYLVRYTQFLLYKIFF